MGSILFHVKQVMELYLRHLGTGSTVTACQLYSWDPSVPTTQGITGGSVKAYFMY